jgi:hypothetical protein
MSKQTSSPSKSFLSAVANFVMGTHLYSSPRPGTLELLIEGYKLKKEIARLNKKYGIK